MTPAFVLLCMASILSVTRSYQIHEHMTESERQSIFNTGHATVPPYEVVLVFHTDHTGRTGNGEPVEVHLKAFGKDYNLSLEPTRGLFPTDNLVRMWSVARNDSNANGLEYEPVKEPSVDIGEIYQDTENMASILMLRDSSEKIMVDGNIGLDLVIRPLPQRLLDDMINGVRGLREPSVWPNITVEAMGSLRQTKHHLIYRAPNDPIINERIDFTFMEPDPSRTWSKPKRVSRTRSKRQAPNVIYPEILCIVDYDGYRMHGGDYVQIKRYFLSFWNAVDLRYKLLEEPKIRISIAGIIVAEARDATPYLTNNRIGRDALDASGALTDMGAYVYRETRFPPYDIAIAVTKLDMCRVKYTGGPCDTQISGYAYVGAACVKSDYSEKSNSVGLVEDTGGFSGIIIAAHELGHLLGAVHDGEASPNYLGGPGATNCRWEDGYIMSDHRDTENGFKWSHCSISSFHHFLNSDKASCLYNTPHEPEPLGRALPGKLLSLNEQCRQDSGTEACFTDQRVCAQLFCADPHSPQTCISYRPAAEGSPCGYEQYCRNGQCVAEYENTIPYDNPYVSTHDGIWNTPTNNEVLLTAHPQNNHNTVYGEWSYHSDVPSSYTAWPTENAYSIPHDVHQSTPEKLTTVYDYENGGYSPEYSGLTAETTRHYSIADNHRKNTNDHKNYPPDGYMASATTTARKTSTSSVNRGQDGVQLIVSTIGHETDDGECTDIITNCASLIDSLNTWLCRLEYSKKRCCRSLKAIC